jgi:cytochrome c553
LVTLLLGVTAVGAPVAPADNELQAALSAEPRVSHGARAYEQHCAACHARDAGGSPDGSVPALAGQHFRYLAKQIAEFRQDERYLGPIHDEAMRTATEPPQTIADVAGYLAGLTRARARRTGPGDDVRRGAELFRAGCQSCHRDSALGSDDLGIPSLRGQHYPYLLRQIGDIGRGHRFNAPSDLILLLKDMPRDDAEAIADYLSRLDLEEGAPASESPHQPGD